MGSTGSGRLVLRGGTSPRKTVGRRGDWTARRTETFLEALVESCNVNFAARTIKVSTSQAYRRRERDATFRLRWAQAIAQGYSQLELMLLERALHGVEKVVVARDGTSTTMRDYSDRTALSLLRMHRAQVSEHETTIETQEVDEARERILARIERLRARHEGGDAGCGGGEEIEQKAAGHERMVRLADLVIALRRGGGSAA